MNAYRIVFLGLGSGLRINVYKGFGVGYSGF